MEQSYYEQLASEYRQKRDFFFSALTDAGFKAFKPCGAYYIMTDISHWGCADDVAFALKLVKEAGVATVPGSAFYSRPDLGRAKVRFCFPKRMETLEAAADRLLKFRMCKL
jgi:aminotransferase